MTFLVNQHGISSCQHRGFLEHFNMLIPSLVLPLTVLSHGALRIETNLAKGPRFLQLPKRRLPFYPGAKSESFSETDSEDKVVGERGMWAATTREPERLPRPRFTQPSGFPPEAKWWPGPGYLPRIVPSMAATRLPDGIPAVPVESKQHCCGVFQLVAALGRYPAVFQPLAMHVW